MRKNLHRELVTCLVLTASGCAMRPTGYVAAHSSYSTYGYSDSAEGGDDYSILVKANPATSDQRVAQLVLLRAAHLTLEKGGNRFQIIHSQTLVAQSDRIDPLYIAGGVIPIRVGSDENKLAALVIHILRPDATPGGGSQAIDAQRVVTDLGGQLQR